MSNYYVTTPIYYVNDRPHIGHCYTTLLADVVARFQRMLRGLPMGGWGGQAPTRHEERVFFLTGTDEHADKVVTAGAAHQMGPLEWATINAEQFKAAFKVMNFSNDDFVRTTEERHKTKVNEYIRELQRRGDIYLGDYVGWWDESQEEYLTETVAKESKFGPYTSPVTGRALVKRTEKNYFFKLSKYEPRLLEHIHANASFIQPDARRNEVLGRIKQGLQDVPISRAVTNEATSQWGIRMPDDPGHRVYVWIEALCNYLSVVDTPDRNDLWPADAHLMAKDIVWFHAVIWPAMLMALDRPLPKLIYAHSYWVREGVKMSKSLGNFVTLEVLQAYADRYSLDAVRWYLLTQGPIGANDADFTHSKFVEVYNADLANGIGNCASRVSNMIEKYFNGVVPDFDAAAATAWWDAKHAGTVARVIERAGAIDLGTALGAAISIVSHVDQFIADERPFTLAKDMNANAPRVAHILACCAEAIRIASVLLAPAMPAKMAHLWEQWNATPPPGVNLGEVCRFAGPHSIRTGTKVVKGTALFMRADPAQEAPSA